MIHRLFFHNWQLKLVAVALGAMVWFTIQRATTSGVVTVHNVRVVPKLHEGWRATQIEPSIVTIEISGERAGVLAVSADHFLAQPDMSETGAAGAVQVEIKPSDVSAPPKIRVLKISPPQVTATLEQTKKK